MTRRRSAIAVAVCIVVALGGCSAEPGSVAGADNSRPTTSALPTTSAPLSASTTTTTTQRKPKRSRATERLRKFVAEINRTVSGDASDFDDVMDLTCDPYAPSIFGMVMSVATDMHEHAGRLEMGTIRFSDGGEVATAPVSTTTETNSRTGSVQARISSSGRNYCIADFSMDYS